MDRSGGSPGRKTALITGATGGMGVQLCKEFARHGYNLVITARSPDKLQNLRGWLSKSYGVRVKAVVADLNQQDAPQMLFRKIQASGDAVDVLVNNAGFAAGGYFGDTRPRLQEAMINVNMRAPTRLCRLFLPGMIRRGSGGVINIASTGSFVAGPYNAIYCATKAYLLSLTEAIAFELRESPVRVLAVCPGATVTGFADRAEMEDTWLFRVNVLHPRQVAQAAYRAFEQGKHRTVVGGLNKAMIAAQKLLPRDAGTWVSGFLQRPQNLEER